MSGNVHQPTKGSILIVDDTPANLRLLAGMLMEQGYKVRPVPNGQLALNAVQAAHPELILLDITMPGMDGYEVAQRLKTDPQTQAIPIIFISALDEVLDKVKAFQSGGVDYITKPFQFEEVLARVDAHLSLRRLQQELQEANQVLEQRVTERTAELAQLNQSLERFVPSILLEFLGKDNITEVKLGDQVQDEMTVMFSDIRGFTTLSEQMSPQENFNFLNAYLGQVSPLIRQHRGFIDKYLGDGLMALFPQSPEDAIKAAIALRKELGAFNAHQTIKGVQPIQVGVGINTGKVMLGVIGEQWRLQGTVISDAVNVASRLEGLTKRYQIAIVACPGSIQSLTNPSAYHYRFIDRVQVEGRSQVMDVFEIFDGDPPPIIELKARTRPDFEQGLAYYFENQFSAAGELFARVLAENPADRVAEIHLTRARHYAQSRPPDPQT